MRFTVASLLLPAALLASPLTAHAQQDIVRTARSAGQFATLLAAADAAGLTSTLQGRGPFTVFAPTDEAFRKLPAGTVETLLKPENKEQLKAILLYHVVSGRVPASTARTLDGAETVEGRRLRIRTAGSSLRINEATVLTADVSASNGVIHVIDEVLLPPASDAASRMSASANAVRDLQYGLRDAGRLASDAEKAWRLREALDAAGRALDTRVVAEQRASRRMTASRTRH